MQFELTQKKIAGTVFIPSSKSDGQRAALIAALGNGTSILKNFGKSNDELVMLKNCSVLGAKTTWLDETTVQIEGNFQKNFKENLFVGESGLGLRLLTAIASLSNHPIEISGEGSLLNRNQSFFETYLPKMGVSVKSNDGKLPLLIQGSLKNGNYEVDGSESSQYISGLLIALSQIEGDSVLRVQNCKSKPYIDMTIHTLKEFGVTIQEKNFAEYSISGNQKIQACSYTVDGDWSSASYWLVASALGQKVEIKGLSMCSLQADKALLNALISSNCQIIHGDGLQIDGSNRTALNFDATNCPDLFPALVTFAAFTNGVSSIRGVHRLANKESNRGEVLKTEFQKLGVKIEINDDEMLVYGVERIQSANVSSHHDHRIAMCLAIAGVVGQVDLVIDNAEAVAKSYPSFWETFRFLSA